MSYTVLARKYRSRTLDDLVGQEPIATTLKNAIRTGRVHHGFLFTGTRGVGKTSSARLLAKSLNCLAHDEPTPVPCCECESCLRIAEGEDIDVIEIDAASNTGVDNIRDLRESAAYRPARARFKIYIIDEVHMLSTGAFNALLKTLEEPPDHVKFILATTEIHKVPATIVSRCQRFDFRSISINEIAAHLEVILKEEGVATDSAVTRRVARLANGSMRDGLSLLDQLLSFGGGELSTELLDDVLPVAHDEVVAAMMDGIADEDAAGALACVEQSLISGQTIDRYCEITVNHLRTLMLISICGADTELIDLPATVREQLVVQAARFDAATYVYMISLMEEVRRIVKSSNASRAIIDAAVVRLALARNFSNIEQLLATIDSEVPPEDRAAPRTSGRRSVTPTTSRPAAPPAERTQPKAPPARAKSTVSSAEEASVRRDPGVEQALDLFDGTLLSVHRAEPATTKTNTQDATDDPANNSSTQGDN